MLQLRSQKTTSDGLYEVFTTALYLTTKANNQETAQAQNPPNHSLHQKECALTRCSNVARSVVHRPVIFTVRFVRFQCVFPWKENRRSMFFFCSIECCFSEFPKQFIKDNPTLLWLIFVLS